MNGAGSVAGGSLLLSVIPTDEPRGFRLVGELDASNVGALAEVLEPEVGRGGEITLDLAELAFMDSSGIQVLIRSAQQLGAEGRLILLSPGAIVRRILTLIPLEKLGNVEIRGTAG